MDMPRLVDRIGCGCVLALALAADGCGAGPDASSSQAQAQVKGKVTVAGKPLLQAEVVFNPSNVNRKTAPVVNSPIKADGTYEVTTLVGQNQVTLTGPGVAKTPQLSYFSKAVDVHSGVNELDIDLP